MAKKQAAKRRQKRKAGPAPKLENKTVRDRFFRHLNKWGTRRRACKLTGIAYNTFLNHMARDPEFATLVEEAENESLDEIEANVLHTAKTDAHLGIKVLERKRRGWQKQQQHMHGGKVRHDIRISVDEQRTRLAALNERFGLGGPIDAVSALPGPGSSDVGPATDAGSSGGTEQADGEYEPGAAGVVGPNGRPKPPSGSSADPL